MPGDLQVTCHARCWQKVAGPGTWPVPAGPNCKVLLVHLVFSPALNDEDGPIAGPSGPRGAQCRPLIIKNSGKQLCLLAQGVQVFANEDSLPALVHGQPQVRAQSHILCGDWACSLSDRTHHAGDACSEGAGFSQIDPCPELSRPIMRLAQHQTLRWCTTGRPQTELKATMLCQQGSSSSHGTAETSIPRHLSTLRLLFWESAEP